MKSLMILIILASIGGSEVAQAGWNPGRDLRKLGRKIDKKTKPFRRTVGDIATFGETARQRDKAKAEKAEAEARAKREAAEKLKLQRIQDLQLQERTLTEVVADFTYLSESIGPVLSDASVLSKTAQLNLQSRLELKNQTFPRVKEALEQEIAYSQELLLALKETRFSDALPDNPNDSLIVSRAKEVEDSVKAALYRLELISRASGIEINRLVSVAIQQLSIEDAASLQHGLLVLEMELQKVKSFIDVKKEKYTKELSSVQIERQKLENPTEAPIAPNPPTPSKPLFRLRGKY